MKAKTIFSVALSAVLSTFVVAGVVYAATIDAGSALGGSSGDDFQFNGSARFTSVRIGQQDVGGVTFFNGTIVNETTTNDVDNPVTFGDNLRIDGTVWRGDVSGPESSSENELPFKVDDDLAVTGNATITGNLTLSGASNNVYTKDEVDALDATPSWSEQTSYKNVHGSAFQPAQDTITGYEFASGYLNANSDVNAVGEYVVPVELPHGATITNFALKTNDQSGAASVDAVLYKVDSDYTRESVATVATTDAYSGGDTTVETTMDHAVDNNGNSYYISVTLGSDTDRVYDVQFDYTFTSPY